VTQRLGLYFHVHLVSDSTGETLNGVLRAATAQFDDILPIEHTYYLVRSPRQMERVLADIESAPGVVMFTIASPELRSVLEARCRAMGVPSVAVLDGPLEMFSRYLGRELTMRVGHNKPMNSDYFRRIDALDFAMSHDDGQAYANLQEADVVLVGVSRTSKTPTSIYLANRGVRTANVPLVPGISLPDELFRATRPLIVALKISPDRLIQIRRNRLLSLNEDRLTDYVDEQQVRAETIEAVRLFERHGWPVIDVTRRSIEETAAAILNMLAERRERQQGAQ
jgi:[pyruvate, water dikinase]-phosphate phosphotransferase / [pyruvate, water dikinase] kinase